jgi:outer membrane protein TolC
MTLPWLDRRKHDSEIASASVAVTEQDAELAAMRAKAFGEIKQALAETAAAQQFASLYQDSLAPQAEATLHAAVVAYENNQTDFLNLLDSQMAVIDIELARLQAQADFNKSLADLEFATGAPVDLVQAKTTTSAQEEKQ